MTAHPLGHVLSLPAEIAARFERALRPEAKSLALVDETVTLRRCALYRNVFRGSAVSYPAALLEFDAVAKWLRRQGVTVDVTTVGGLDRAVSAGMHPSRIVMHRGDGAAAPIRRAVRAGVGTFVVNSSLQVAILADGAERIQRVIVEGAPGTASAVASQVLVHNQLDLIGLHCRLDDPDDPIGASRLRGLVAEMSAIRREHGVLLTRVSIADLDVGDWCHDPGVLRRVAEAVDEVIGDACARFRFPRPALTLSPKRAALLPA